MRASCAALLITIDTGEPRQEVKLVVMRLLRGYVGEGRDIRVMFFPLAMTEGFLLSVIDDEN